MPTQEDISNMDLLMAVTAGGLFSIVIGFYIISFSITKSKLLRILYSVCTIVILFYLSSLLMTWPV